MNLGNINLIIKDKLLKGNTLSSYVYQLLKQTVKDISVKVGDVEVNDIVKELKFYNSKLSVQAILGFVQYLRDESVAPSSEKLSRVNRFLEYRRIYYTMIFYSLLQVYIKVKNLPDDQKAEYDVHCKGLVKKITDEFLDYSIDMSKVAAIDVSGLAKVNPMLEMVIKRMINYGGSL